jgi:phosphohistidine swiveling domain-containing protein
MKEQRNIILNLADADCSGIGNKARRLAQLMQQDPYLFTVPSGLVVLSGFDTQQHTEELLSALEPHGDGPFAVRSCGLDEDGADESMAGKFHTELFVSKDVIIEAICSVRKSYGTQVDGSAVLIQQMVEPDFAGVLFTRSPENYGLSSCEYGEGTADAVVSGKVEPVRADYGRWTGTIYPARKEVEDMLSLLFLVGLTIEVKMGQPQDIEWAYDKKKRILSILQSRDITSQLYDIHIAKEQEKSANIAAGCSPGQKGSTVFKNAAVREVVVAPTRLTRSFVERLYAPTGSLGKSFDLIGLPCPPIKSPYVSSLFGRLYENIEVEKKLFGFHPKLLWANRKIKKKLVKTPEYYLTWLRKSIENFPQYPVADRKADTSVEICARGVMNGVSTFLQDVYPVAYAATLLAQLAGENTGEASLTSQMMRDLSRLHHTGGIHEFIEKWGLRSANDYELSEPRFCESPEAAMIYADNFSDFPWGEVACGSGFTHLKEVAKDRAIQWLYPLRLHILNLEKILNLKPGLIFSLDFTNFEALAEGRLNPKDVAALCEENAVAEAQWATVSLGDNVSLETLERLQKTEIEKKGLHGRMVSTRVAFKGKARHLKTLENHQHFDDSEIIIAEHLEPELVGLFPRTVGCLVDMGGALSHAAIVARELGYPILVLAGCSSTVCDGDFIAVSAEGAISITR